MTRGGGGRPLHSSRLDPSTRAVCHRRRRRPSPTFQVRAPSPCPSPHTTPLLGWSVSSLHHHHHHRTYPTTPRAARPRLHYRPPQSMAVLVILLLVPFLPSTALAAFSPDFAVFLACGAASNISFPRDSPARTFTPDAAFLTSSRVPAVANANSNPASPLYAAARASSSAFSYEFSPAASNGQFLVLRLHFFPFAAASQPAAAVSISSARFAVSVLDAYTLLPSSFSPPRAGVVKEFFVPATSGGDFRVTFTPDAGSAAFVNAVELFSAPPELLWNQSVTPVGAAAAGNISLWQQQALETAYRLNVGGPAVTTENDTLWRTWLPDAPFLFGPPGLSVVNSTTSPIVYDPSSGVTREVAPDAVYRTQRATNASAQAAFVAQGPFNVTWTFPADARADYLVRLHFCDYEMLSSVVGVGIVFNVFVAGDLGYRDLAPTKLPWVTQSNQAFYLDFAATAPVAAGNNLTVSIGMSAKSSPGEGGILNGLEIMKLLGPSSDLSSRSGARSSKKRVVIIIALSAVLGASVLAALLCFFFVLRRRRRIIQRPAPEKESTQLPWSPYTQDGGSTSWVAAEQSTSRGSGGGTNSSGGAARMQRVSTQLHIPLAEITAATDGFHERNLVGVGGFGNVYRGVLRDGTRVAVKRAMRATKQGLPEFQTEIVVLSAIRHRHLVSLIGYCNENAEMILVYEYMEKGTLRSHLYGSEEPPLSWKQRLEICIGAARGLHYLHTGYSDNIIHRDVKSTNILLGDGFIAKVADFGLSRMGPSFGETHVSTAVKGSFGYLDPEYFKTQQLTDRSDVYSFGVVLFEVLCARPVIDQQAPDRDQINLAEWALKWHRKGQIHTIADPRILAQQVNDNSLRKFAETAAKCLADYGMDRPSMGDVLWNLEYCLQLQETHVRREAFEDSGAAATQFPDDVVVPRWMPSSTTILTNVTMDDDTTVSTNVTDNSKVFFHLSSADGR